MHGVPDQVEIAQLTARAEAAEQKVAMLLEKLNGGVLSAARVVIEHIFDSDTVQIESKPVRAAKAPAHSRDGKAKD